MAYRDNVQALCDQRKIGNPISEPELAITAMRFFSASEHGKMTEIEATDMNRGARLFLEQLSDECGSDRIVLTPELRARAATYFDSLWLDAEQEGRKLIIAFKDAASIIIFRKL